MTKIVENDDVRNAYSQTSKCLMQSDSIWNRSYVVAVIVVFDRDIDDKLNLSFSNQKFSEEKKPECQKQGAIVFPNFLAARSKKSEFPARMNTFD